MFIDWLKSFLLVAAAFVLLGSCFYAAVMGEKRAADKLHAQCDPFGLTYSRDDHGQWCHDGYGNKILLRALKNRTPPGNAERSP